jgi:hypothetical protein
MKSNFDYQTLEQALEAAGGKVDRSKVEKANPEGFGPETKRVMQEVYAGKSQDLNDAAVAQAQWQAYNILAARELTQAEDLDDIRCEACNIRFIADYLKGERKEFSWEGVLGNKAEEIVAAVIQDLGLTLEEAEKLSEKYDGLYTKRVEQLKKLGWTPGAPVDNYLGPLGWKEGEPISKFLGPRRAKLSA